MADSENTRLLALEVLVEVEKKNIFARMHFIRSCMPDSL